MRTATALRRRPQPPADLLASPAGAFRAAPELDEFARFAFLSETSPLYNRAHDHLRRARLGFLWTTVPYVKQQRRVAGRAMLAQAPRALSGWDKALYEFVFATLFGAELRSLDFVVILDAPLCAAYDDASFCALLDHELYHCAQKRVLGAPKFRKSDGRPVFCILGHDEEQFVGVIERYGAGVDSGARRIAAAARRRPLVAAAAITRFCGTVARAA